MSYTESITFKDLPCFCSVCGRPLDDATSREFGIGPHCRKSANYDDAYPISDILAGDLATILDPMNDVGVRDRALEAIYNDDSRRAANVLNHALCVWRKANPNTGDVVLALRALHCMGYETLADTVAKRTAKVLTARVKGRIVLKTPYSPDLVDALKAIPGSRFHKAKKAWSFPEAHRMKGWKALREAFPGHLSVTNKGYGLIPPA